jgi:hypothetical protein
VRVCLPGPPAADSNCARHDVARRRYVVSQRSWKKARRSGLWRSRGCPCSKSDDVRTEGTRSAGPATINGPAVAQNDRLLQAVSERRRARRVGASPVDRAGQQSSFRPSRWARTGPIPSAADFRSQGRTPCDPRRCAPFSWTSVLSSVSRDSAGFF